MSFSTVKVGPVLEESLRRYFKTGQYSDMKVKDSQGTVYDLHKLVVCGQSEFFENALKKNTFKEGHEGIVELPDDDPTAVRAMLQYMYEGHYAGMQFRGDNIEEVLLLHLKVYLLADKYRIEASRSNPRSVNKAVAAIERTFHDLPAGWTTNDAALISLRIYACARLRDDLTEPDIWPLCRPVLARVVKAVYEATTKERDGMLRGVVDRVAAKHVDAILQEDNLGRGLGDLENDNKEEEEDTGDILNDFGRGLVKLLAQERDRLEKELRAKTQLEVSVADGDDYDEDNDDDYNV